MTGVDYRQGDYRVGARRLLPAAHHLVELAGVTAGQLVLDVAAGTGTSAVPAAERGAEVVATDRTPELLRA